MDALSPRMRAPAYNLYPRGRTIGAMEGNRVEDRVISEVDSGQQPASLAGDARSRPSAPPPVAALLARYRDERGLSKADLAKLTGLDPSTITRFEQGARMPERETILLIANALVLPMLDRDRLLAAAGYRSELWDDPHLVELAQLLNETGIAAHAREEARSAIRMAIAYLKLHRLQDF